MKYEFSEIVDISILKNLLEGFQPVMHLFGDIALKRSLIWTILIAFLYLVIGIGNDNYQVLFGRIEIMQK